MRADELLGRWQDDIKVDGDEDSFRKKMIVSEIVEEFEGEWKW